MTRVARALRAVVAAALGAALGGGCATVEHDSASAPDTTLATWASAVRADSTWAPFRSARWGFELRHPRGMPFAVQGPPTALCDSAHDTHLVYQSDVVEGDTTDAAEQVALAFTRLPLASIAEEHGFTRGDSLVGEGRWAALGHAGMHGPAGPVRGPGWSGLQGVAQVGVPRGGDSGVAIESWERIVALTPAPGGCTAVWSYAPHQRTGSVAGLALFRGIMATVRFAP